MRTQLVDGLFADLLQVVRFLRVYKDNYNYVHVTSIKKNKHGVPGLPLMKYCIFANKYSILNIPNFIQYSKHKIQTVQGNPTLIFSTFSFFRLGKFLNFVIIHLEVPSSSSLFPVYFIG